MFVFVIILLAISSATAGYDPDTDNIYYLFTRASTTTNQTLIHGNSSQVLATKFDPSKKTVVTIHGWLNSETSSINTELVPVLLTAEDINLIIVDWSAGAYNILYPVGLKNTIKSAPAVATFLTWLNNVTGADFSQYHIVGHSLGAHQAGLVGRALGGVVAHITGLDPAGPGFGGDDITFRSDDAIYTEVFHTNGGLLGYGEPLGQVDFYFSGGTYQPGCFINVNCDHGRSYLYLAESIASGGFNATRCSSYDDAKSSECNLNDTIILGGMKPKTGISGIYHVETNSESLFSKP